MSLRPILYYTLFSPPSRACLLTSIIIGLNLDLKCVNFAKKEQKSDWFLKVNPRHTVPVLVDQGVRLCDSHAIVTYMISKYGQSEHDHLYPREDLLKRAVIDERLYYENGELFQVIKDFAARIFYDGEICYNRRSIERCLKSYSFMEEFLVRNSFVAGETLSVADISINTSLITLNKLVPVEERYFPKMCKWMRRMENELPEYQMINENGAQLLFQRFEDALEMNMAKS